MTFPTGWSHKFTVTIDRTKVTGTPTGFVLLVTKDMLPTSVIDAGSTSAQDGGGDIRFTNDSAGSQRLPIEVVDFHPDATSGNRRCEIWVNMNGYEPTTSTDKVIYGWCKASTTTSQPWPQQAYGAEAVWSSLDYRLVCHMNDAQPVAATGLWLTRPRAVEYNGATYYTWLDIAATKIRIAKLTHSTGAWLGAEVGAAIMADSHAAPTLYVDGSGYLFVLISGYTTNNKVQVFKSTNAEDISAWGTAVNVTTTGAGPAYPVGFVLSNGNHVVLFRYNATDVRKVFSSDGGATWSSGMSVASSTLRPYFTAQLGASDRLHVAWDLQNTGTGYHTKLMYCYTDNADSDSSTLKAIDGSTVTAPINSPTTVAGGLVYDYTTSWDRAGYIIGFAVNGSNVPMIGAGLFHSTNTDKIAAWEYSSSAWNLHDVVSTDSINVGAIENRSEGDIRFVSGTTWRCIFQITVSSRWEVQEYESTDSGSTWAKVYDITASSPSENVQPQYVRGTTGTVTSVHFQALPGLSRVAETYNTAKDPWFCGSTTDNTGAFAIGAVPVSTSFVRDSTKYRNHGTKQSAAKPVQATGLVTGYAQTFDASSSITFGTASSLQTNKPMSESLWAKPTSAFSGVTEDLVGTGSASNRFQIYRSSAGKPTGWVADGASAYVAGDATTWAAGTTLKTMVYWDGTTVRIRTNKTVGATTAAFSGNAGGTLTVKLSERNRWIGEIDEYRRLPASNTDLSDTEYDNQNSPSTFATGADVPMLPTLSNARATSITTTTAVPAVDYAY